MSFVLSENILQEFNKGEYNFYNKINVRRAVRLTSFKYTFPVSSLIQKVTKIV